MAIDEHTLEQRTRLARAIAHVYAEQGDTQAEIALKLGLSPSDASKLMHAHVDRFALDRLVELAASSGLAVTMTVDAPAEPQASERPGPLAKRREPDYTEVGAMKRKLFGAFAGVIASHDGRSQAELSELFGIARSNLYAIRTGDATQFKLDKLVQLAPKFAVTVDFTAR
ncbi:XRE family transcriptional regulator [Nocardia asteroides]|uniref:XRE family transcriptional regulator n=1 Tax=Nocardia asteroides TaxID=1824 RepID=UPI0037C52238